MMLKIGQKCLKKIYNLFYLKLFYNSVSGVSDHYANDDYHALHITKTIIANLNNNNNKQNIKNNIEIPEPPLYPDEELYGIVGDNLKKNYDVREVIINNNYQ